MKIYDESLYCQECGKRITVQNSLFGGDCCDDCYELIHGIVIPDTREEPDVQAISGKKLA